MLPQRRVIPNAEDLQQIHRKGDLPLGFPSLVSMRYTAGQDDQNMTIPSQFCTSERYCGDVLHPRPRAAERRYVPKLRRKILDACPSGVHRSCGYPNCSVVLRFAMFEQRPAPKGEGADDQRKSRPKLYCDKHQPMANARRRTLRDLISEIDELLLSPESPPRKKSGMSEWTGITTRELQGWRSHLVWELQGMPGSHDEFSEPSPKQPANK